MQNSIVFYVRKYFGEMDGEVNGVGRSVTGKFITGNFGAGWGATPPRTSSPCASTAIGPGTGSVGEAL
jgi:hypothetical protein